MWAFKLYFYLMEDIIFICDINRTWKDLSLFANDVSLTGLIPVAGVLDKTLQKPEAGWPRVCSGFWRDLCYWFKNQVNYSSQSSGEELFDNSLFLAVFKSCFAGFCKYKLPFIFICIDLFQFRQRISLLYFGL